jgi:hypothetical protein
VTRRNQNSKYLWLGIGLIAILGIVTAIALTSKYTAKNSSPTPDDPEYSERASAQSGEAALAHSTWNKPLDEYRAAINPLTISDLQSEPAFKAIESAVLLLTENSPPGSIPDVHAAALQMTYSFVGVAGASRSNLTEAFRRAGSKPLPDLAERIRKDWSRYPESRLPSRFTEMTDDEIERLGYFGTAPFESVMLDKVQVRIVDGRRITPLDEELEAVADDDVRDFLANIRGGSMSGVFNYSSDILRSFGDRVTELPHLQLLLPGRTTGGERILLALNFVQIPGAGLQPVSIEAVVDPTHQKVRGVRWVPML